MLCIRKGTVYLATFDRFKHLVSRAPSAPNNCNYDIFPSRAPSRRPVAAMVNLHGYLLISPRPSGSQFTEQGAATASIDGWQQSPRNLRNRYGKLVPEPVKIIATFQETGCFQYHRVRWIVVHCLQRILAIEQVVTSNNMQTASGRRLGTQQNGRLALAALLHGS